MTSLTLIPFFCAPPLCPFFCAPPLCPLCCKLKLSQMRAAGLLALGLHALIHVLLVLRRVKVIQKKLLHILLSCCLIEKKDNVALTAGHLA